MNDETISKPGENVGRRAASSAVYLGGAQVVRLVLTVLSAIIIARLLSPDDYGVVAMAAPVVAFVAMFQELGLSTATVQSRTLSAAESNAMFWVNVVASLGIAATLVAVAPLAAWFYDDVRAGYVTAVGALGVLISGLSLQHGALLNRDMRFAASSAIEVVNSLITFVVAALLALWLRSYWALIVGTLAGSAVQTVLLWRSATWRPGLISFAGAGRFVRFGGGLTGFNLVNFATRNADNVLIAKMAGSAAVGLYDRSYKLMMMPIQTINGPLQRLLLPILSKMQNDPDRYRRTFVFTLRTLALVTIPGIAVATALSDRLMPFLLGDRWASASPIFFWLGLAGLFNPVGNLTGLLFMTSARTGAFFRWGIFSAVITLAGFAVGIFWGAEGVAASFFVTTLFRIPFLFAYSVGNTGVKTRDLYEAQIIPILLGGIGVAAALALAPHLSTGPLLCLAFPIAYLITGVAVFATASGRETAQQMMGVARGLWDDASDRICKRRSIGKAT